MLITLTTDFGPDSFYVAQLRGAIASRNPTVPVVDITHSISPQDVWQGAWVLNQVVDTFPTDCIHLVVIDPEVGTDRRLLYVRLGRQQFLLPDNGLITAVARRYIRGTTIALTNRRYWAERVSNTFHGRDILAPVAAHLSLGASPSDLGEPVDDPILLPWPVPVSNSDSIDGQVMFVDRYGNLITNIAREDLDSLGKDVEIACAGVPITIRARTYGDHPAGTLMYLIGSGGYVEIAIAQGNAALRLSAAAGTTVHVYRR